MPVAATLLCLVITVQDGDSLRMRCGQRLSLRVRVAAIDAPELRQAFGQEARKHLQRLCLRQQAQVTPQGHDVYGRQLARVRCAGQDVGRAQLQAGLAWVYTPQAGRYPELAALQRQARVARRGLWVQKRPQAPWIYRQSHPRRG